MKAAWFHGRAGALPICDHTETPNKGSAAIAMRAENQTANRVPEFCRLHTASTSAARIAMDVPSTRQSTNWIAEVCARALHWKGARNARFAGISFISVRFVSVTSIMIGSVIVR